ncbi:RNA exonuclease 1 homolog [Cololabis saira]|uniref:RNA exonuclease 1 homolog n=1 Tax=Cololabis saira TaxID=129043 RepID=UPI002AD517A8|nr:RNA exonuclease 1 homolog [Cololabis saira]
MFPSAGLFADINCPFAQRGLCERPHCSYKHTSKLWDTFGSLNKSTVVDLTGERSHGPHASYGAPGNETAGTCLHELERINKEIETVRHEVEREQRRLSSYQTVQAESKSNAAPSRCASYESHSSADHKALPRPRKYVVDSSRPRTDLEYDPMSNFSAALQSYSSSAKEKRVKNRQDLKKSTPDQKEPATRQAHVSQSPFPVPLDDSNEDGVLIIDYLSLPEKISGQLQKPVDSVGGKFSQDSAPLNLRKAKALCDTGSSSLREKKNDIPEPTSLPVATDQRDHHWESPQQEPLGSEHKMKGLDSLFRKVEYTDSPPRQHAQKGPTAEQSRLDDKWPRQSGPSVVQEGQKISSTKPVQMHGKSTMSHLSSVRRQEQAGAAPTQDVSSVKPHLNTRAEPNVQLQKADPEPVIIISSSPDEDDEEEEEEEEEEEDIGYLELDLSDSDPMEECYRIFMEANDEDKEDEEDPDTSTGFPMETEKPEMEVTLQAVPGKKRVAHEAKNTEQPLAKVRPQPQVLVPLREPGVSGFGLRPSFSSKVQQVQQRASTLTSSVKAAQAFTSSNSQKKLELPSSSATPTLIPENLQLATVQNGCLNYIPVGTTVVEVGNGLHLILPQGAFPLSVASSTSSPVTSVLTPVSQVQPSAVTAKETYHPPGVTAVQRFRSTAPLLIDAPPRRPPLNSALASTSLHSLVSSATHNAAVKAATKPAPSKRKLKQQQCEAAKEKVPHNVRQRYVNIFTEEFLKTTPNVNDAFQKALAEEKTVYSRSVNKLKYLSIAVNALKRLKNQSTSTAKSEKGVSSQRLRGNIPLDLNMLKGNDDAAFYESLKDHLLSDDRMIESNYPVQHPEKRGCAVLFADKKVNTDPLKRICCRCGATYSVSVTGKHIRKEECNYHSGKGVESRVPGGVETRYSCCQGVMGAPGCQLFKLHVHDHLSLDGFVSTALRCHTDGSCPGVYSLNCEMCYTVKGLELSRVTVVSSDLQVIYDTFVRADKEVIDYNTRFSGISEKDVKGTHSSLREVQDTLLSFISADTILVGHGLEMDLCLLKLLHGMVVDTSVVFPHRLGPPHKLSLNNLTAEYLRRIIQESVCGHDTAEDAAACMELMLWRIKEDGKWRK